MREREVESYLIRRVKAAGGDVRKAKWIGHRGAPDRLVLLPANHFLVELKKPKGGDLENHQVREHARLRKAALAVYVAYTQEDVDEILGIYLL